MFSHDKNIETIGQLVEVLKHYIGLRAEYMKLDVVDKVVRLLTVITMGVLLSCLLFVALIYISFAVAYALSSVVGMVVAFSLIAAFYLFLLFLFVIFRHQWIEKPLVKFLASLLLQK